MSQWASSHGLQGLEDKLAQGLALTQGEMALLQGNGVPVGSSIAPSGFIANQAPGNQLDIWNDFVRRVQDAESGGSDLVKSLVKGIAAIPAFFTGGTIGADLVVNGSNANLGRDAAIDAGGVAGGAAIAGSGVFGLVSADAVDTSALTGIDSLGGVEGVGGDPLAGIDVLGGPEGIGATPSVWSSITLPSWLNPTNAVLAAKALLSKHDSPLAPSTGSPAHSPVTFFNPSGNNSEGSPLINGYTITAAAIFLIFVLFKLLRR